ncbi:MAG: ATP synthase F1 subunit delta [Bacteroidia bacterium]|nr:ATP synthase F1 subunit delta [Bacteroidia bacterium]
MHDTRSAIRYARSLFLLALERSEIEVVFADMTLIGNTIRENKELDNLLKSPIIKADRKISILNAIFKGKIGQLSNAFLELLVKKRREMHVGQIARSFMQLYFENNGIEEAQLITAFPVDEEFRQTIIALVAKQTHQKVELQETIDNTVIGGFVLRFGNKQIDASISTEMAELRREFEQNLYIKDY